MCGCGCQSGMGEMSCADYPTLMGFLSGITDPVHQGAPFSLCVEFSNWAFDTSFRDLSDVMQSIQSDIQNSGYTQGLVRVYQLAGFLSPFVCVEGYAGYEYSSAGELRDGILGMIAGQYSDINYGSVRFEVTTYTPSSGATQQTRQDTPQGSGPSSAPPSLIQSLTGGSAGPVFLVGGAILLAVILLKR